MRRAGTVLFLALAAFSLAAPAAALEAGAAAVEITPALEPPAWLAGFAVGRQAESVHDPLWARALVLRQDQTTVALVALDLVGYLSHRVTAIKDAVQKELGIPAAAVVVASTHTHHGPDTIGLWGPKPGVTGVDPKYLDRVDKAALEAIRRAHRALVPVTLKMARTTADDLVRDSRQPEVVDPEVFALQAIGPGGKTVATLSVFGCHPEVLWSKNPAITSDYPHYLRAKLERDLGGTSVFFAGALGGLITPKMGGHTFEHCQKMGEGIAGRILEALAAEKEAAAVPRIVVAGKRVEFPLTNIFFRVGLATGLLPGKELVVRRPGGEILIPTDVSAIALGPAVLVTAPGELFPELSKNIKEKIEARHKVVLGLANSELGYIVPHPAWKMTGYEERMSAGRPMAPLLHETWLALLRELKRAKE